MVDLEQASRVPAGLARRPSTRTSIVTRPVSSFRPASVTGTSPTATTNQALVPLSYSPPFALSSTPPFAIPSAARRASTSLSRAPSIPQLNAFPPSSGYTHESYRYGSSPTSYQAGSALARALTNTAIRIIGSSANSAATALVRAASKRRPTIHRTTEVNAAEDDLLRKVEDLARKAFVLFELADSRLVKWQELGTSLPTGSTHNPPFANTWRRKSSSSSANSEITVLRQQEAASGEAVLLYAKAMSFITLGTQCVKTFVDDHRGYSDGLLSFDNANPSPELVESKLIGACCVVQS
jgi:serine/threonine-protein kinase ULK/ATG1